MVVNPFFGLELLFYRLKSLISALVAIVPRNSSGHTVKA